MISVDKAKSIILKNISPLKEIETTSLSSCLGRVSALDIKAKENIPPFNNSAMDGFAIKAKDSSGASRVNPKILEVIEDLPAGYTATRAIKPHQAIRIMTGAPLPKGADSVIMVEDTKKVIGDRLWVIGKNLKPKTKHLTPEYIEIFKGVKKGENVRYAGEDVKKGEVVIRRGSVLKSGHIGMLASLGITKSKVFRRPKVGILATGDELIDVKNRLKPGKIRNSNTYSLYAQVIRAGGLPILLGIARDAKVEIAGKIKKGLKQDMLVVSGGVSVGDYDLVKDVLNDLGTEFKFWKVAMRPGKPLVFGLIKGIPVFGLPGNPVSSMVAFEQFTRPAILKMAGAKDIFRFHLPAIAKEDFRKKKGLRYFLRTALENKNGTLYAYLTGPQGSGILKSMVLANGIMELPEDMTEVRAGQKVQVTYLD